MYLISDLFDKRSVVGTRLFEIMNDKDYTKANLCKLSGVSRPTLDKLLAGTLTNKVNYEKHLQKVLDAIGITPDMLMGVVKRERNETNKLINLLGISNKQVSQATGISVKRLKQIESGEDATISEYRDIACFLGTDVRSLMGEKIFDTQVSTLDIAFRYGHKKNDFRISGFWGHVGIKISSSNEFLWYPISGDVKEMITHLMNSDRIVIPCMNNKVLYLNMDNIKEITLLDDACDIPDFGNWNYNVDSGEIPMVVYEALEDYYCTVEYERKDTNMSSRFMTYLKMLIKKQKWDEEEINDIISEVVTYYSDGEKEITDIEFENPENISEEIETVYNFQSDLYGNKTLYYHNLQGAVIIINVNKISMIELPLVKTEEAVYKSMKEMLEDMA